MLRKMHADFFRSASGFMNILVAALKIIGEHYPGRLHKAFVIDPPSLFPYLWKGVKAFIELSSVTTMVSSLDFDDFTEFNHFTSYPRAASLRFDPSFVPTKPKVGSCSSSRFSFTVSPHLDTLKPWHLTLTDKSSFKVGPTSTPILGSALISPFNARSYSFASPTTRNINPMRKSFFPSTPLPQKTQIMDHSGVNHPRTPKPSFLHSPALFFKRECHLSKLDKCRESFIPFLRFYRRPYDEMIYRSKMKPPLGGLISIVSPRIRRYHMSVSQRF
ncbi:putative CRAL-TRIO lipid binding domain-containing protein [Helianthus debilis subsp. tardiflorus]